MQKDVFDYITVERLPNSMALIPYYGGNSSAVHCNRATNVIYFLKTFASMNKYFTKVVPFVQNDYDFDLLNKLPGKINPIKIECDPIYLPIYSLKHVQENEQEFPFDYIFYTEGDHILYCHDLPAMAAACNDNTYIMPWRFTRIPTNVAYASVKFTEMCPTIRFDDKTYEIRHYTQRRKEGRFFQLGSIVRAFSGCWLLNRHLFLKADFRRSRELPIEHACWSLFERGRIALKTSDPLDFFVDHLSGYEQTLRDSKNIHVKEIPGVW